MAHFFGPPYIVMGVHPPEANDKTDPPLHFLSLLFLSLRSFPILSTPLFFLSLPP